MDQGVHFDMDLTLNTNEVEAAMTELFFRDGSLATKAGTPDARGRATKAVWQDCHRCGGAGGSPHWRPEGGVCFKCWGRRGETRALPIYTQARLDKLVATAEKRAAKRAEKAAAEEATAQAAIEAKVEAFKAAHGDLLEKMFRFGGNLSSPNGFLADLHRKATQYGELTERQIEAAWDAIHREEAKGVSTYIGEIGERLDLQVTIERVTGYETQWGWTSVVTMRDAAGNAIVSKGSFSAEQGDELSIRATVKEHTPYGGEKQTVVQRVKVV